MPNINANSAAMQNTVYAHSSSEHSGAAVSNKTAITNITNVATTMNAMSERYNTHTLSRYSSEMRPRRDDTACTTPNNIKTLTANHLKSLDTRSTQSLFFDPDSKIRLLDKIQNLSIIEGSQSRHANIPKEGVVISLVIDNSNKKLTQYFSEFYYILVSRIISLKNNIKLELFITATNDYERSYNIVLPEVLSKRADSKIVFECLVHVADEFIKPPPVDQAGVFAAFVLSRLRQFLQHYNPEHFNERYMDNVLQGFPRLRKLMVENSENFHAAHKEENGYPTLKRKNRAN
jgi:hypothetical protein